MDQSSIAILIIGASMFIPLWIGAKAGEKDINTVSDFFIQDRDMGLIMAFFTIQATWWSAFAFIGATGYYYYYGPVYWTTFGWDILFGILFLFIGKRIWFYGKENQYMTSTDFFMDIYQSEILGVLVTGTMMLFTIPYFEIQISGGAYLIEEVSKGLIPSQMGAFVFTTVIVIYVWTGGLRAVAWADVFYEILILASAILSGAYIIYHFGGIDNLFTEIYNISPASLTLPNNIEGSLLWMSMFIIVPIGAIMGPPLWIRMYAIREAKIFYIMPFLLAVISIVNISPMLIGNAGILLETQLVEADTLFPKIIMNHVPNILAFIIIIGGAAAAMSTSNSQIHAISALYTIDIHKRYINKKSDDKRLLSIGRIVILIFAVLSFMAYVYIPGLMVQIGLIALSGTAQIFVPTVGALFWEKSNAKGAVAGIIAGIIALAYFSLVRDVNIGHAGLLGLVTNTLIFILISIATKTSEETRSKIKDMKAKYNNAFR